MHFLCTNVLRFFTIRSRDVALGWFLRSAFVRRATHAIPIVTARPREREDSHS